MRNATPRSHAALTNTIASAPRSFGTMMLLAVTAILALALDAHAYVLGGPAADLTPRSTDWSWDGGSYMDAYRGALTDDALFGPSGTVPVDVTLAELSPINAASLAAVDGFISPFWNELDVPTAALDAIIDFFLAGGDLILLQDTRRYDAIGAALGVPTIGASDSLLWNGSSPLFDGPFATANVVQAGLAGRLDPADVALTNGSIGATNASGQITAAYWQEGQYLPGAGNLVVVTDVDTFSTYQNNANYILLDNEALFALNSTAFEVIECGDGAVDPGEQCDDANTSDGDGCDSNCTVTGCGNAVLTAPEQCDDGNTNAGDGCSPSCACEAASETDGDGIPDACDNCPAAMNADQSDADVDGTGDACDSCPNDPADDVDGDGVCADADFCPFDPENDMDLDGLCANRDPCTNPLGARDITIDARMRFKFVNADPTPGNDRLLFSAEFVLPPGMAFPDIDPQSVSVRFRVEFSDGTSPVDVTFPLTAYAGRGTSGWTRNGHGTRWGFLDATDARDSGLVRTTVEDHGRKQPGLIKVKVFGKDADYPVVPSDTPFRAIVTVGDGASQQCGEANFVNADCRVLKLGYTISCRLS